MNKLFLVGVALFIAVGCEETAQSLQAERAMQAANQLNFADNAEIKNIERRLTLTGNPGLIGYIVLMNDAGQPVLYTTVKGKVTSGSKRLTSPDYCPAVPGSCPSDEGTYGSSNPYIYFWDQADRYHQWSGEYLYSDQPIRLSIQPLVISEVVE